MYTRCRSVSSNSSRKRTRWGALKLPSPASRDNGEGKGGTTGRKERGWRKGENRGWDGGTGNGVGRRQAGGREEKEWRRQGREGKVKMCVPLRFSYESITTQIRLSRDIVSRLNITAMKWY